jgi:Zn-dependent protease with chaperone function
MQTTAPARTVTRTLGAERLAGRAASTVTRAGAALAVLTFAGAGSLVLWLFATWRLAPTGGAAPHVSIFGHPLTYPDGNPAALIVLALAAVGVLIAALAGTAAAREVLAARRLTRRFAHRAIGTAAGALVIEDERPRAFCTGLLRPKVFVSSGAVAALDEAALRAVLAHERHHARRRDPLRLAGARVLARAVPGLGGLVRHQQMLLELSADEGAAEAGGRSALARAMLAFSGEADGVDPARVDYLLGSPPSWRFPTATMIVAIAVAAAVIATAFLVGQAARGSLTLAPPGLSRQPCVAVLAMIPVVLAVVYVRVLRASRSAALSRH